MQMGKWFLFFSVLGCAYPTVSNADDFSDLKGQVEEINSRIEQLSAVPAVNPDHSFDFGKSQGSGKSDFIDKSSTANKQDHDRKKRKSNSR